MRKTVSTKIGTTEYSAKLHPATEGYVVMTNLLRLVGVAVSNMGEAGLEGEVDAALISRIAERVLADGGDKKLGGLVALIVKYTSARPEGETEWQPCGEVAFDDYWAGKYLELHRVVAWIVKENFAEVFQSSGIGDLLGAVKAAMPAAERAETSQR